MLVVQPAGVQIFHHQSIIPSTITTYPHKTWSSSPHDFDHIVWEDDTNSTEEYFPTALLDDEVWSEDPIPNRQLCIQETPHEPNHQFS